MLCILSHFRTRAVFASRSWSSSPRLQVVYQKALQSVSLRELKADVKFLFATRYTGRGFQLPTILHTDMCCEERALMVEIFREMRDEGLRRQGVNGGNLSRDAR